MSTQEALSAIQHASDQHAAIHGYRNVAARVLVAERDALAGHGGATVEGEAAMIAWLEATYGVTLTETRRKRTRAGQPNPPLSAEHIAAVDTAAADPVPMDAVEAAIRGAVADFHSRINAAVDSVRTAAEQLGTGIGEALQTLATDR